MQCGKSSVTLYRIVPLLHKWTSERGRKWPAVSIWSHTNFHKNLNFLVMNSFDKGISFVAIVILDFCMQRTNDSDALTRLLYCTTAPPSTDHLWFTLTLNMYTLFNKNQAAWNFLRPAPEVPWRTDAIIIRVVLLFPYLCISDVSVFHSLQSITPRIY
jgi:hypothetical protein